MNRRAFFVKGASALVGACVAAKLPTGWLPAPVRRTAAIEFLTHAWNAYTKGRPYQGPIHMWASGPLFDAFESELIHNKRIGADPDPTVWGGPRYLMFKAGRLARVDGPGWQVGFPDGMVVTMGQETYWRS